MKSCVTSQLSLFQPETERMFYIPFNAMAVRCAGTPRVSASAQIYKKVDGQIAFTACQLVEHRTRNAEDVGSAPTGGKLSFPPLAFPFSLFFYILIKRRVNFSFMFF